MVLIPLTDGTTTGFEAWTYIGYVLDYFSGHVRVRLPVLMRNDGGEEPEACETREALHEM
jgi:hypothetical protein